MKKYKLKRDLPTKKAGSEFYLDQRGLHIASGYIEVGDIDPFFEAETLNARPEILEDWFEEIIEQPRTVWDLKEGERAWKIGDGNVYEILWHDDYEDERDAGDIFLTKEEAEKELARRKAKVILERDTKGFKPDWKNRKYGWNVIYNLTTCKLFTNIEYNHLNEGTLRFATQADAEWSIKNHRKEWKTYLGVEE